MKAFSDSHFYYPGFGTTPLSLFPSMSFVVLVLRFEIWRHQAVPVVS
jgi:hypothetical protein